jgi:acyl-CoA synthetase (AMP-forming)/AMP-acid ligase II
MLNSDTVPGLLQAQSARGAQALLVVNRDRLSYAEADRRSACIASALLQAGVGRGAHVALLFGNSPQFAIAFLAITRIGAIAIPLSTLSTAHELHGLLRGADAEYLIAAATYRGQDLRRRVATAVGTSACDDILQVELPTLRRIWFGVAALEAAGQPQDASVVAAGRQVTAADTLAIVHTSGSTSAPKGVIHTHGQVIRNMRRQNALRNFTAQDRLFSNSPFFWIGGLAYSFLSTLIAGARLICTSSAPADTLDVLEAEQPTLCNGVASTVLNLAQDPSFAARDLACLRRGNLYPIMPADVRPADPELRYNLLGMTETGSVSLCGRTEADLPEHKRGSFGQPVAGIEARIVDPQTGADSDSGEFRVRGANIMQGYYGRERAQVFDAQGWFHTGDFMHVDADGDFFFEGRGGDIIRTAGAQVSPREVEGAISHVTGGRMAIVIGLADTVRGQSVAAVLLGDAPFDADALRAALKTRLSAYKIPQRFVAVAEADLPTLSSGKVDLKSLARIVADRLAETQA